MNNLSIIIPYYNGKKFIFSCIDSILKSYNLSQKKIMFEIIVIVDSPEEYLENKMDIAAHYNNPTFLNVFLNEQNSGVATSRNKGLELSRYNFITYIDQDDQVNYNYFSIIENQLSNQYHCIIYNGYWHYISNAGYFKLYFTEPDLSIEAILKQHFTLWTPGLMIINKTKIQISKYFIDVSDNLKGCDDWAALINMLLTYPNIRFNYIRTPIFIHNRHAANFSNDTKQMYLCQIAGLNYFKGKVNSKLQKVINQLIDIRTFELRRYTDNLPRKILLLKHSKMYFKYLYNKWIYLDYPLHKLKKTWYALFENKYNIYGNETIGSESSSEK